MDAVDECYNVLKESQMNIKENSVDYLLCKHTNLHEAVYILINGLRDEKYRHVALMNWDNFRAKEQENQ